MNNGGLAFTYENMMKAVHTLPEGGEPLTVEQVGSLCSIKVDPEHEQGKFSLGSGFVNHLQVICNPKDETRIKEQLVGSIFQVHRERYGLSEE